MLSQFKVLARVTHGVFQGSVVAEDAASGRRVRIRVYPKKHPGLAELYKSVLRELREKEPWNDYPAWISEVINTDSWIVLVEEYEAWASLAEVYSRKLKLQTKSSIARALAELGIDAARRWRRDLNMVPLFYPANLMASASGQIRFRYFITPENGRYPRAYFPYAAPEEYLSSERTPHSLVFNLGAILYELLEGSLPSSAGSPWNRWLRYSPPRGRQFHKVVGSPARWLSRSPALRHDNLEDACYHLVDRNFPAYPQTLLKLAEEPMLPIDSQFLPDWLEANYDIICADLITQQAELAQRSTPTISGSQMEYIRLVNQIDAGAAQVEAEIRGPVVMKAHVSYQTLLVKDLLEYLNGWQSKFSAYQSVTGLNGCDLVITHFRTGNSFDAEIRIKRRQPKETDPLDPTAGMFAFNKLLDADNLPPVDGKPARATKRARKAKEQAANSRNLHETLTIAPARGGD